MDLYSIDPGHIARQICVILLSFAPCYNLDILILNTGIYCYRLIWIGIYRFILSEGYGVFL